MENQPIPEEFLKAMREFEEAAFRLLQLWPESDGNTVIPNLYPFKRSFDDVCIDITLWREDCERA